MNKAKFTIEGSCVLGTIEDGDGNSAVLAVELEKEDFDPEHVLADVLVAYRERLDWLLEQATSGRRVWGRLAIALHLIDVVTDIIASGSYDVVVR
jgi:hypothetical protein